ncbi:MAG: bifunctional phosphoribosyl-AMP cyclohydrolase/phosphoribosyl-ATP diphosphatase HisIE [Clostridiales bacterium]|nr:bifunctional phosphoribosyl-AMP cyclohydrolase/phosphoribosyl-ATP diphosphatase HisIE [Clostridiales bacterium]
MPYKRIIPLINTEGEINESVIKMAKKYSNEGADQLLLYNFSKDESSREEFLKLAKMVARLIDIPLIVGCYGDTFDDIKRAFYTGAEGILILDTLLDNPELLKEASLRFGSSNIYLAINQQVFIDSDNIYDKCQSIGIDNIIIKYEKPSEVFNEKINKSPLSIIIDDELLGSDIENLLGYSSVVGITSDIFAKKDIMKIKHELFKDGFNVNVYKSSLNFSEFKLNQDGLIPVITQDYRSGEVLMLAYMNQEAYNRTIEDGRMFYYSRSRKSLWLKGESSGNIQYVKELSLDCDKDTLLAKVLTLGPSCHTGNNSCFYTNLVQKDYKKSDPYHIMQNVYNVIMDRKNNPKEGSYTNYLFDKGIDKILKKCGEEATEIIIAAKNPQADELRYEIADFLYHLMVLMAECGLDLEDITTELADRR